MSAKKKCFQSAKSAKSFKSAKLTGDGRHEAGDNSDKRQETGDKRWETGDGGRRWEMERVL